MSVNEGNVNYSNVVTLIADPEKFTLNDYEMNTVVDALQGQGAIIDDVEWLSVGRAVDIFFAVLSVDEAREVLTHLLEPVALDFVVQVVRGRRKKLLISDMDSTMINQECIDELAGFAGLKDEIAIVTERAMNGELDFKQALEERVAKLKGLKESVLQECFDDCITLMSGAEVLVKTMKKHGATCVLVSGGFTFFTSRVAEMVGFDVEEANILTIVDGELDGTVKKPILDSQAKVNALLYHAEQCGISAENVIAVGDGANDLPMIQTAGTGIAYHAKAHVQAQAKARINCSDLQALLYVQGYKDSDMVIS